MVTWAADKQRAHRMQAACRVLETMAHVNISGTVYYSAKRFDDEMFFGGTSNKLNYLIPNLHMYFVVFILLCCLFRYIYEFVYLYSFIYLCLFNDHISNSECMRSNGNVVLPDLRPHSEISMEEQRKPKKIISQDIWSQGPRSQAVPQLKRLVAGFPPRRPGFASGQWGLWWTSGIGAGFLRVLPFPLRIIPPLSPSS
jgi:hypothetical protein